MGKDIVGDIASTAVGGFFNIAAADKAHERQKELMGLQLANQQTLNKQGQQMQYEMWEKTNYPAQVAMLRAAGLNPSMLYAKGGQGGVTGSQTGGSAASGGASQAAPMDISGLLHADLLKSQAEKNRADAKKANVEATKTAGPDTNLTNANIENTQTATKLLTAQVGTEEAKKLGMEIDNQMKSINKYILDNTKDLQIDVVKQQLEQYKNLNIQAQQEIEANTKDLARKDELLDNMVRQGNINIALTGIQIAATKAGITYTTAQTNAIATELEQAWKELEINADKNQVTREGHTKDRDIAKAMNDTAIEIANRQGLFGINRELMGWAENYLPSPKKGQKGHRPAPTRRSN